MQGRADPAPFSFFKSLAATLAIAVAAMLVIGLGGITGPGWYDLEPALFALMVGFLVLVLVNLLFLMRIGSIFDVERAVRGFFAQQEAAFAKTQKAYEESWASFRDDWRGELIAAKEAWRQDLDGHKGRLQDLESGVRQALQASGEAQRAATTEMQRREQVTAPLLKQLEAEAQALRRDVNTLQQKVAATLDGWERRDMEHAAEKARLERDLADLRRREQLLTITRRERDEVKFAE